MKRFILLSDPRTGSTFLSNLLNSFPGVNLADELLNSESSKTSKNIKQYLSDEMKKIEGQFIGFKMICSQLVERNLSFNQIIEYIGPEFVIVLWRKSVIEQYCSLKIALKSGVWFRCPADGLTDKNGLIDTMTVNENEFNEYFESLINGWKSIGKEWPINLTPIYLCYEDLIEDPVKQLKRICCAMGCDVDSYKSRITDGQLLEPIPREKRISNWDEISENSKNLELNVKQILESCIQQNLLAQCPNVPYLPDPEPTMPSKGWVYNVSAPFMPNQAKDNVLQALASESVSSAGFWPKQLSIKLKQIFEVPVAQPCSNGFTALLLSMQTIGIRCGDEVIMPAMTMIAVPNSVSFIGGTPVFADCAHNDYNPGLKEILKVSTNKTRAIVLTHTYGVPTPDLELIVEECHQRGWVLIEDISECVGVKVKTCFGDKYLGTFGQFSAASLYANKIVHSGDGGFVLAKDPQYGARLKSLVNHGFTPNYHFLHFENAVNAKINGLGAALAVGCFDQMDQVLEHRHLLAHWYRKNLKDLPVQLMPQCGPQDTPWVFGIHCTSKGVRAHLRSYLAGYGIETRDYFFPLHFQPAFKDVSTGKAFPRAENLGSTGFYLPTFYGLKEEDIIFITDVIKEFFSEKHNQSNSLCPPFRPINEELFIKSGSFSVEVNRYTKTGQIDRHFFRGHPLISAINISVRANELLITENWSQCQEFIQRVDEVIKSAKHLKLNVDMIEEYFKPYVQYFKTLSTFEPTLHRPWIVEDLKSTEYNMDEGAVTTSDDETLQLLVWIIKQTKPKYILELGSWMGHSSIRMANAAKTYETSHYKAHIYACDSFKWQNWMSDFAYSRLTMTSGQSFLERFEHNIKSFTDFIQPIVMNFNQEFPEQIKDIEPDFVLIDFSKESEDLDKMWTQLEPNLKLNKTIILFNGLAATSLPFLTRHSNKLKSLAKPHSIAKAFLFSPESDITDQIEEKRLTPKFKFQTPPDWTHHYKNAFNIVIDRLRDELFDKNANILFIPAVEETLCDYPELMINNPWIGIIHMTPDYPDLFYIPDLKRLCSKRYDKYMENCKGLYTLTKLQAEYLNENLRISHRIPVQPLVYPYIEPQLRRDSTVVDQISKQLTVELILIGCFARDYSLFGSVIVPKNFKKVILINDENSEQFIRQNYQDLIELRDRLPDNEYEDMLFKCIPFLSLKYDGAANTLLLECIARNLPILVPNMKSCIEYIGEEYPLIYSTKHLDLTELLTKESIESAINYLKKMNKNKFQINYFMDSVKSGVVLQSLPKMEIQSQIEKLINPIHEFPQFDVTLLICSYKRTHHLKAILDSLWNGQTFKGKIQIIVWNNNDSRNGFVGQLCKPYLVESNPNKSLELIGSTKNYFCSVRLSVPQLMQSQCLLICDDDCIPGPEFIEFFINANQRYPKDILCLRGHQFFEHKLNLQNPQNFWEDYEYLRFRNDEQPEQSIHFVHADTCLVPKSALQECASIPMPDPSFALVDDYWMSYILNHKFGRNLRKLSAKGLGSDLVQRTDDSDQKGLALYTRPEVNEARLRLYIHHMLQGWPVWEGRYETSVAVNYESLKKTKTEFWDQMFVGYNVSSKIDETGIDYLKKIGVKCVRIGAVGLGDRVDYEFSQFLTDPEKQMNDLKNIISLLKSRDINVVLTLCPQLSGSDLWRLIAQNLYSDESIVGYDLINEPFTQIENNYIDLPEEDPEYEQFLLNYIELIKIIRKVDKATPIIIESSFWAHIDKVSKLTIDRLLSIDDNIMVSFHFYEPQLLTNRKRNQNRYSFPSEVPINPKRKYSEMIQIDENYIHNKFKKVVEWSTKWNVKLVLGEFGISREIIGADYYLDCILKQSRMFRINCFVYSFRDEEWDSMDYELGTNLDCGITRMQFAQNTLMQTIVNGINNIK